MTTVAYTESTRLEDVLAALAGGAEPIAGGTDLVVGARSGKRALPESLVALHGIEGLGDIEERRDGGVRLGALVTHAALEAHPRVRADHTALSEASALVGSPATRSTGTIGGNLCNASPAMEAGSPLLVFEALIELSSARGNRVIPLAEFLVGPGRTTREADELLVAVELPPRPTGSGSAYVRLQYRQAMEIAVVGAAALVVLDGSGGIVEARVALTAVAPVCLRVPAVEAALRGRPAEEEALAAAAALAAEAARPIGDVRASEEYRRAMVPVLVTRALSLAAKRAREGAGP